MDRAKGIDLSAHQSSTPPLGSQDFVIARACYGDYLDPVYQQHATRTRNAGKVLGAYAFGRRQPIADQVRALFSARPLPDFYVLDYENDVGHPDMTHDQVRAFIARVQDAKGSCGLYANQSGWFRAGQDWTWIAAPGNDPARQDLTGPIIDWTFRQRQSAKLDGNLFDGTVTDLQEWIGMKPLRVTIDKPHRIAVPAGITLFDPTGTAASTYGAAGEEIANQKVRIGSGDRLYWIITAKDDGTDTLLLAPADKVQDKGPVVLGGATDAELAAQRAAGFADAKGKAIAAVEGI